MELNMYACAAGEKLLGPRSTFGLLLGQSDFEWRLEGESCNVNPVEEYAPSIVTRRRWRLAGLAAGQDLTLVGRCVSEATARYVDRVGLATRSDLPSTIVAVYL
jgi:hypothetical protein